MSYAQHNKHDLLNLESFKPSDNSNENEFYFEENKDGTNFAIPILENNIPIVNSKDKKCSEMTNEEFCDLIENRICKNLTAEQFSKYKKLLCEYKDICASSINDLGVCNLDEYIINLTDEMPVSQRIYEIPLKHKEACENFIQTALNAGLICRSNSSYACNLVFCPKKDGDTRVCCNYTSLNSKTIKDKYPLPYINDLLDKLGGAKVFSSIDMFSAYHQIPIAEKDKHKTAFACHLGLFEWDYLPFGLCNAPSFFSRIMDRVLENTKKCCLFN